jgi:hypothetical protein
VPVREQRASRRRYDEPAEPVADLASWFVLQSADYRPRSSPRQDASPGLSGPVLDIRARPVY